MRNSIFTLFLAFALTLVYGQPSIPLPAGYTWVKVGGTNNYTNGPFYTGNASGNNSSTSCCSGGGTSCGTNDTSFGGSVQCASVPWNTIGTPGANFIQSQIFGNLGTCNNGLAGLAVVCNPGVGSTAAGTNWPASTSETRRLTFTNWTNTFPASTIEALPQASRTMGTVWLPMVAAFDYIDDGVGNGTGAGADELRFTVIGGIGGNCSTWNISANYNLSTTVSGPYGSISGVNGVKFNNNVSQTLTNVPDAGSGNAYHATDNTNHNSGCGSFQSTVGSWFFPSGNQISFGDGHAVSHNILSALVSNGSTFDVDFRSEQSISLSRSNGDADARATMGPGMGGKGQLRVDYDVWEIRAPLPVGMKYFDINYANKMVSLNWGTYFEVNNEGFEIQRSSDFDSWEPIGFVNGNNNSKSTENFNFLDEAPLSGKSFYRLKQMDFDGRFSFSEIRKAFVKSKSITINPNPTEGNLSISNSSGAYILLMNANGNTLISKRVDNDDYSFDISTYPTGIYFVRVTDSGDSQTYKIFKL